MSSTPNSPTLEELLAAARRGELLSGEIVRYLRPAGVMGSLAQMPLTEILQNMDFGKKSGRVDVFPEGAEGAVHVHDGQIVHAVATTPAGTTEGEEAILELCRRPGGAFCIQYKRDEVERSVHRPTTFVLLEALRVIDEASAAHNGSSPQRLETPAAVDLGGDPWSESTSSSMFPPDMLEDDPSNAFNDPSAILEIEVAPEMAQATQQHPRYRVGAVIHVFANDVLTSMLLEDVGRGGAFLRTEVPVARGEIVTLRLPSKDAAVDVPARIVHVLDRVAANSVSREPGIGVQFENLTPDVAARLNAFVEQLATAHTARNMSPLDRLRELVAESEFLVAAGDLESAQRVLSQAQGLAPEDDDVRRKLLKVNESIDAMRANAFLEQAMRGGPHAVELARRATQLRPTREVLLRSLAVFARGGAHDEIADVAEQLLELDPNDEGALRTLLDANVAMQRWTVAARAAESLLRLRPHDEQLQATLQKVLTMARQQR